MTRLNSAKLPLDGRMYDDGGSQALDSTGDSPARRTRAVGPQQAALFALPTAATSWEADWWGMPSFTMGDARPSYRISVNFHSFDDVLEFARRLGVAVTARTDSMWFPQEDIGAPSDWRFDDEP